MFTDKLFDHKYDIDDIIFAFLQTGFEGRMILNSTTGELLTEAPLSKSTSSSLPSSHQTAHLQDGDNNNHIHIIEPLPVVFFENLTKGAEFKKLKEEIQTEVRARLTNADYKNLADTFSESFAASWIRGQVKAMAIEWLEMKDMIPPSMRHVRDIPALKERSPIEKIGVEQVGTPQGSVKIQIEID